VLGKQRNVHIGLYRVMEVKNNWAKAQIQICSMCLKTIHSNRDSKMKRIVFENSRLILHEHYKYICREMHQTAESERWGDATHTTFAKLHLEAVSCTRMLASSPAHHQQ
jgi:hypothetical protein